MDHRILDKFISEHRKDVLKYILGKVKNPQLAEDLTQDVFLRFVEKVRNSQKIRNLNKYLFTIARNRVYDYWKKTANDRDERDAYWREIQINKIVNTFPLIQNDRNIIYNHLEGQITDQQKKIFFLNRKEGLSYSEIADRLQLSKSTVKNHMVAALRTIRNYMDKHADKFIIMAGCGIFYLLGLI